MYKKRETKDMKIEEMAKYSSHKHMYIYNFFFEQLEAVNNCGIN